jgi:hypothetical protein
MGKDPNKIRARMKAYNAQPENKNRANARQRANRLTIRGRAINLVKTARYRAKTTGLEFDLTVDGIAFLIENSICPYTMQSFVLVNGKHPWAPSIDRLDNSKGYTTKNIAVVSLWWNIAKNEWPGEITTLALAGLKQSLQDIEFE